MQDNSVEMPSMILNFDALSGYSNYQMFILVLFLLFPVTVATVANAGGLIFLILSILGMMSISEWKYLQKYEKNILIGFIVFFICMAVSLINTTEFMQGIHKLEKYRYFLFAIPIYLLIRKNKIEVGRFIVPAMVVAEVVMAIQTYYQLNYLGMERATGAYNPLIIGGVAMLIAAVLVNAVILIKYSLNQKIIIIAAILLGLYVTVSSGSRGVMLFVPLYTLWLMVIFRKKISLKTASILAVVLVLIFSVAMLSSVMQSRIDRGIEQYNNFVSNPGQNPDRTDSLGLRVNLWLDSVTIWKQNPMIGTGLGDFLVDSQQLYSNGRSNANHNLSHAHSIYFDALATAGFVGLCSLLILIFWHPYKTISQMGRNVKDDYIKFYKLSGTAVLLAYMEFGMFEALFSREAYVSGIIVFILLFMNSIQLRCEKLAKVK